MKSYSAKEIEKFRWLLIISTLAKCGAPEVPIRQLHHQLSGISLSESNQQRSNHTDYVNTNIEDHTW